MSSDPNACPQLDRVVARHAELSRAEEFGREVGRKTDDAFRAMCGPRLNDPEFRAGLDRMAALLIPRPVARTSPVPPPGKIDVEVFNRTLDVPREG